jgi:hypothetical protein
MSWRSGKAVAEEEISEEARTAIASQIELASLNVSTRPVEAIPGWVPGFW